MFLRNVLIYFEPEDKLKVLERIRSCMLPHAWLIIGSTENIRSVAPDWQSFSSQGATIYRPPTGLMV